MLVAAYISVRTNARSAKREEVARLEERVEKLLTRVEHLEQANEKLRARLGRSEQREAWLSNILVSRGIEIPPVPVRMREPEDLPT